MPSADSIVLCYHAVSSTWEHPMSVHPDRLRAQIQTLLERGYRPVTLSESVARPSGRMLVVTFDDGFLSTYALGLPILRELGVRATAFVTSSFLTSGQPVAWDGFDPAPLRDPSELRPMSWDQAAALASTGWEIGSHTVSHPVLPKLDDDGILRELSESSRTIAERLGRPCKTVAYPFGAADGRVLRIAQEVGYSAGVTLGCRRRRYGPLDLPRIGVYRVDDRRRFALKVSRPLRSPAAGVVIDAAKAAVSGRA